MSTDEREMNLTDTKSLYTETDKTAEKDKGGQYTDLFSRRICEMYDNENYGDLDIEQLTQRLERLFTLTPEEIRGLSPEDWERYLYKVGDVAQDVFVDSIGVHVSRLERDLPKYFQGDYRDVDHGMSVGNAFRIALGRLMSDQNARLTPDLLTRLYDLRNNPIKGVSLQGQEMIFNLIYFDMRNRQDDPESYLGLYDRYQGELIEDLLSSDSKLINRGFTEIDTFWAESPDMLPHLLLDGLGKAQTGEQVRILFKAFTDRIGVERTFVFLQDQVKEDPSFDQKFKELFRLVGLGDNVYSQLREIYEAINFDEYAANSELQAHELGLVQSLPGKKLDIACGTGRLLRPLHAQGQQASGFDLLEHHVDQIKATDPSIDVLQGDWGHMPYEDGSFDSAYCLGRSILHCQTIEQYQVFMRELRRVLKDGGEAVIDIADSSVGNYAQATQVFGQVMSALGISYYEDGSIIDGPDPYHFAHRLVLSPEQFRILARIQGFECEELDRVPYGDPESQDVNIYWKLKKSEPLGIEETLELHAELRTGGPPISVQWL